MKNNDVVEIIESKYKTFSKGHKLIADYIFENSDKVAYMTAAKLGRFVGVSESTVVRFAHEMGYDGYSEFQKAIQELVRAKLTPNQRIEITKQRIAREDILESVAASDISKIRTTFDRLDKDTFNNVCETILEAKRIYITGARSSEPLALILNYNLSLIFDNVTFISPKSTAEVFEQMFSIGEHDLLIAFSFPRYSSKMINAVRFAEQNRAKVIVFTDSVNAPFAKYATYLLTAQSDMASFMDSFVAPMSIINAMIIHITHKREREITERFDKLEQVWDEYGVYTKR